MKILVVDDSNSDRALIKQYLHEEHGVVEAESAEQALGIVEQESFDLVLLDTNLTGIDGFEACQKLKNLPGAAFKVVMMTGAIDVVDAVKARKMGADDYCVKTFDCEDILRAVKEII